MRTPGKFAAALTVLALLCGCTKAQVKDAGYAVEITAFAAVVVAGTVTGVIPVMRMANEPTPLEKLSPAKKFPNDAKARALAAAVDKGDVAEIDRLVAAGADVNAVGEFGLSVAEWALFHPNKDGFRRLLERGADANKLTQWTGNDPYLSDFKGKRTSLVHLAAYRTAAIGPDYLRMVLETGKGDPNLEPPDRLSRPIMMALGKGNEAALLLLLGHGAELEFLTADGLTPLRACAGIRESNFRLALFLLNRGVSYSVAAPVSPAAPGFHGRAQAAVDGYLARNPFDPEAMWMWRCVDFLERRGQRFESAEWRGAPVLRPVTLDTTPVDLSSAAPEPAASSRRVVADAVELTLPRPAVLPPGAGIGCRCDEVAGGGTYGFYREGAFEKGPVMVLTIIRSAGKSFDALSAAATAEYCREIGENSAALVESAPDHAIHRLLHGGKTRGYLYAGLRNGRFVTLRQAVPDKDQGVDARALESLRHVDLAPGFGPVAGR